MVPATPTTGALDIETAPLDAPVSIMPIQSNLVKDLAAQATENDKFERAKKFVAKQLAFRKAIREGTLSRADFDRMPLDYKKMYKARFGVPASSAELKAQERAKEKNRAKKKAAKKARKTTRQRSR